MRMKHLAGLAGAALIAATSAGGAEIKLVEAETPVPKPEPVLKSDEEISRGKRMTVEDAMERTGTTSPKAALDKLKEFNPRYHYLAHTGAKQKAKAARARIKAERKAAGLDV